MLNLKDKKVLVVGLGRSGVAASRLLIRNGANVTATDSSSFDNLSAGAKGLHSMGVKIEANEHRVESFISADLIVLSPGVPKDIRPLTQAKERGIRIISEIELACRFADAPVIAITGSNGKSTTTTLIGEIIRAKGDKVFVGGNIGTPLCDYVLSGGGADCIVAEISSFQLGTIEDFRPKMSVLLNISPDHLDRYHDMKEYTEAKFRIFENQGEGDFTIINGDESWSSEVLPRIKCNTVIFSRKKKMKNGVYAEDGWIVSDMEGYRCEICEIDNMGIRGVHNLENAMASAAVALLWGCEQSVIEYTLRNFPGLEHRLEFVRELNGVRYINDSKGTNVGAVIKSIESFNEPLLLIAGGRDKGSDFLPLRPLIKERVKRLILIGEAREKIRTAVGDIATAVYAGSLEEAVHIAHNEAAGGDVVLLSPACASFDMFKNFEERGRLFKEAVWRLTTRGMKIKYQKSKIKMTK